MAAVDLGGLLFPARASSITSSRSRHSLFWSVGRPWSRPRAPSIRKICSPAWGARVTEGEHGQTEVLSADFHVDQQPAADVTLVLGGVAADSGFIVE